MESSDAYIVGEDEEHYLMRVKKLIFICPKETYKMKLGIEIGWRF